jgi:hypothetical protein
VPSAPPAQLSNGNLQVLGRFIATVDGTTGQIDIREAAADGSAARTASLSTIAENSTNGVVAWSPAGATGCTVGSSSDLCGPVAITNRTTTGRLRNVYAIITSSTYPIGNSDPANTGLDSTLTGSNTISYGHLSPSNVPAAGTQPATSGSVGFRGVRSWRFVGASGHSFSFAFHVVGQTDSSACSVSGTDALGTSPTTDQDCDGVPGVDRRRAIFVDYARGNDSLSTTTAQCDETSYYQGIQIRGTVNNPFKTIAGAQACLNKNRGGSSPTGATLDTIIVAGRGTHTEASSVNLGTTLVALAGGYNGDAGFDRPATAVASPIAVSNVVGLSRSNVASATLVYQLQVTAANGVVAGSGASQTAQSSYGARVLNSSGTLTLNNVTLTAGTGATGPSGTNGTAGSGICSTGGSGGVGDVTSDPSAAGSAGSGGAPGGNGQPADTSACTTTFSPVNLSADANGGTGSDGSPGVSGGSGAAPAATLTLAGFQSSFLSSATLAYVSYSSTNSNACGGAGNMTGVTAGSSGGGGAAGGFFCDTGGTVFAGGNGGSGGGGGCAGASAGTGGKGGGASIALVSVSSSIAFAGSTTLATGGGGAGGSGGSGGAGASGASGSAGTTVTSSDTSSSTGGTGGTGGIGGSGGNGAGGNGGPSLCVLYSGTTVPNAGYTCSAGAHGAAGNGGTAPGAASTPGYSWANYGSSGLGRHINYATLAP